jgi:hypothetical protein
MPPRWSWQNCWISAAEARVRSWWSSWCTLGGPSGIGTDYFLSTLTLPCQLTIPPELHIHPSNIWAIKGHSSKKEREIKWHPTARNKYHSEWWNKETAYSWLFRRHRKIAERDYWFRNVCPSVCLCVAVSPWNKSAPSARIVMEFYIWIFKENVLRKMKVLLNYDKYKGYFTWWPTDIYENISLKCFEDEKIFIWNCREIQNTYFVFNNFISFENDGYLWDNAEKYSRTGQATDDIWCGICALHSG